MWECSYSREPFDYRLTFLRLLSKIWILPVGALIGFILFGGIYYLDKMVFGTGRMYKAETKYYIDFAEDKSGVEYMYINEYTWAELADTDFFVDYVYDELGQTVTKDDLRATLYATVASDPRYLYTNSTTKDPELSFKIEKAFSDRMIQFGEAQKEFDSIEIVQLPFEAKDVSKIRITTANILGASMGLFLAIVLWLAGALVDTSIYIPATLEKRYHKPVLGAASMPEFKANCELMLKNIDDLALVPGDGETDISGVQLFTDYTAYANPIEDASVISKLQGKTAVVIVKAGAHNGKRLERTLEELGRIGTTVVAFALIGENTKLINRYYRK